MQIASARSSQRRRRVHRSDAPRRRLQTPPPPRAGHGPTRSCPDGEWHPSAVQAIANNTVDPLDTGCFECLDELICNSLHVLLALILDGRHCAIHSHSSGSPKHPSGWSQCAIGCAVTAMATARSQAEPLRTTRHGAASGSTDGSTSSAAARRSRATNRIWLS